MDNFNLIFDKANLIFFNTVSAYENELDGYLNTKAFISSRNNCKNNNNNLLTQNSKSFSNNTNYIPNINNNLNMQNRNFNNLNFNNNNNLNFGIENNLRSGSFNNSSFAENYKSLIRPMVKFSDALLRNDQFLNLNHELCLKLKKYFVELSLKGLALEESKFSSNIPKIFGFVSSNNLELEDIFTKYSLAVKTDYFLNWKSQLIAILIQTFRI